MNIVIVIDTNATIAELIYSLQSCRNATIFISPADAETTIAAIRKAYPSANVLVTKPVK